MAIGCLGLKLETNQKKPETTLGIKERTLSQALFAQVMEELRSHTAWVPNPQSMDQSVAS